MNLRPTKLKVIASIILTLVEWILFLFVIKFNNPSKMLQSLLDLYNKTNLFSSENIALFVAEAVIIYLILSLFHRRRQHWNLPIKHMQKHHR